MSLHQIELSSHKMGKARSTHGKDTGFWWLSDCLFVSALCSQLLRAKRGACRLASYDASPIIPCKLMLLLRDKISFCETITLTENSSSIGYYPVGHLGYPLSYLKPITVFFCSHRLIPLIDHENIHRNDC